MSHVGTDSPPIVALVDHRDLTRVALLRLFSEALPGAVFVGTARVKDLSGHSTPQLRAVIIHIDHAETGNGSLVEVIASARAAIGGVPLVTLSESSDEDSLRASIEGGASAHLTTEMPLDIVAATLRLVMLGGTSFPVPAVRLRRATRPASGETTGMGRYAERLTQREEDVLKLVGQGAQNKIIAFRLHMSENTVKVHLHRILQKLHLHNRTEVALVAQTYFASGEPAATTAALDPPVVHAPGTLSSGAVPYASTEADSAFS